MTTEEILNKIHDIKFYNVSYRDYFGMIENYVICIHPFVIKIIEIYKPIEKFVETMSYLFLDKSRSKEIMSVAHYNYYRGECNFDPCVLYEEITGDFIHTHKGNIIEPHTYDEKHYKQISEEFNNKIPQHFRKEKLKKLNTL